MLYSFTTHTSVLIKRSGLIFKKVHLFYGFSYCVFRGEDVPVNAVDTRRHIEPAATAESVASSDAGIQTNRDAMQLTVRPAGHINHRQEVSLCF